MTDTDCIRVLHLIRSLKPGIGGPLTYLDGAVKASEPRVRHTAIALDGSKSVEIQGATEAKYCSSSLTRPISLLVKIWKASKQCNVMHIHGAFGWHVLLASLVCHLRGVAYVITPHGHLDNWSLQQKGTKKRLYLFLFGNYIFENAAKILVNSAEELSQNYLQKHSSHLKQLTPSIMFRPEHVRRALAINSPFRALFLARLHYKKQLPLLLEALACAHRSDGPVIELEVAGEGDPDYLKEIQHRISLLGLSDRVHFHGFLDAPSKEKLAEKCDFFVLPSLHENFGIAVIEALSWSLPVIISRQVALATFVEEHGIGCVVSGHDAEELARAMLLFADHEKCRVIGNKAASLVRQKFSLESFGTELITVYEQADLNAHNDS